MDLVVFPHAADMAPRLLAIGADLGHLTGQAEGAFVPVGALLGKAVESLAGVTATLEELGRNLHGEEALQTTSALSQAVAAIRALGETGDVGTRDLLPKLEKTAEQVAGHAESLRRIVSEVTALSINGKIQAALAATAGVDFTVFTSEIGRLGSLAAKQIEQAAERLVAVRSAIATAIEAESSFARNEAAELQNIRLRLEENISQLSARGHLASQAMEAVGVKSRQVADKVARTIGELQITDITCQRIEHVRTALGLLSERLEDEAGPDRLGAALCRLQQQQLQQASIDYVGEIESLIGNLRGLSGDATDLLGEADRAFADSQGGLFLVEIERDVARAIALVEHYDEARTHRNDMIEAVSRGFKEMTRDLEAIRSIDADMRIMGLNATLKCGRLGRSGMALGVVAQELRACSRRTEEGARNVGDLLGQALETARLLSTDQEVGGSGDDTLSPTRVMADSVASLHHLSEAMAAALERLRSAAPEVAAKLADCAGQIVFHRRVEQDVDRCFTLVGEIAGAFGGDQDFSPEDYEALRLLVEPLYTMDSERLIHRQFDGMAVTEAPAASSVDDFFF